MKALVLSPVRLREAAWVDRLHHYQRLLRRRLPLECRQVRSGPLARAVPAGWVTVALDERGEHLTTEALSTWLQELERAGRPGVAFLIGAADGLDPADRDGADRILALSRLTLPHALCFVLVAEQLYRAVSIWSGHPYHRGRSRE